MIETKMTRTERLAAYRRALEVNPGNNHASSAGSGRNPGPHGTKNPRRKHR